LARGSPHEGILEQICKEWMVGIEFDF